SQLQHISLHLTYTYPFPTRRSPDLEAMGRYMPDQGLTDVYIMAPNYAAGKDMLSGFQRYFKGRIESAEHVFAGGVVGRHDVHVRDRKSTRLNCSHVSRAYAVICL